MNQLRQRRKAAGLTTMALAAQAEAVLPEIPAVRIRPEYITDIETGRNKNPSSLMLLRLAVVLGCKPEVLLMTPTENGTDDPMEDVEEIALEPDEAAVLSAA